MEFRITPIVGLVHIVPTVFRDERGYFLESYRRSEFVEHGIVDEFVQDNQSFSQRNTIRGLHFQKGEYAQSKLVSVVQGEVFDVAVDIREGSKTYGQWWGVKLSADNHEMLYIPAGFAHGFCVTSDTAVFTYKCGAYFQPSADGGVVWNDPELAIAWPIDPALAIVSAKDAVLPTLRAIGDRR